MRGKMNKGISMVEVLISIVIFLLLMAPIVSGIVSSMKSTTDAKTQQYRNEYVENLVEYVKQDSLDNVIKGEYFSEVGSFTDGGTPVVTQASFYKDPAKSTYDSSLEKIADAVTASGSTVSVSDTGIFASDAMGDDEYYPYESYVLSGKVKLGTKKETYSYKMEISNEYYAQKQADTAGVFINPNNLAMGVVEDIDYRKIALINGTIANYDNSVSNAFLAKKLEVLKKVDPDWYEVYTQNVSGMVMFPDDTATRKITIKVSGSEKKGYKVVCGLTYHDNCEWNDEIAKELADYNIEYFPFEYEYPVDSTTKKATLPNVYLMYNVCLYNGRYSSDDYIVLDTKDLEDDTPVDLFIVETASTYSQNLLDANDDLGGYDAEGNRIRPTLYNNNVESDIVGRNDVNVHIAATNNSNLKNVSVYHNFDVEDNSDYNKKNDTVLHSSKDADLFNPKFSSAHHIPLVQYKADGSIDYDKSVANFKSLNEAEEESRGLYKIRVWMEKGSDPSKIDTSKSPTITATKGGNES